MDGYKGGLICIPEANEHSMLNAYGVDLQAGIHLYLTESRTENFRFFVDFDVDTGSMEISARGRLVILRLIYLTVRLFYPAGTDAKKFTMMILDNSEFIKQARKESSLAPLEYIEVVDLFATQKKEDRGQKELCDIPLVDSKQHPKLVSNNMHIVFPMLIVNQEQAYSMGQAIACKFTTEVGDVGLGKPWRSIIDSSVYISNGLRMPGSRKCAKCPDCKGKRCSKCHDMGKVDLGKVYNLVSVYANEKYDTKMLRRIHGNYCQMLHWCTIRQSDAKAPTAGWKRWVGCPALDVDILQKIRKDRTNILHDDGLTANKRFEKITSTKVNLESMEDKLGQRKQKAMCITLTENSPFFKAALDEIQRFHVDYKRTGIRSLTTTKKHGYFRVCTIGEGSQVCMNLVRREHKSNSIYFVIKPSGVYQKCWCTCETEEGRKYGLCRKFMSASNPLLSHNLSVLFPHHRSNRAPLFNPPFSCDGNSTNVFSETRILSSLYMTAYGNETFSKDPEDNKKINKKHKYIHKKNCSASAKSKN